MKLKKRKCDLRIRLTPFGGGFLRVHFKIGGDDHRFYPSSVMGDQFSSFLTAVYCLYNEGYDYHEPHRRLWKRRFGVDPGQFPDDREDRCYYRSFPIEWDQEGSTVEVRVSRCSKVEETLPEGVPDPIVVEFSYWKGDFRYEVDGRDLCYAIARAYTEAIKKYGFWGYLHSTVDRWLGDSFEMSELLYVKAYALGAMEVRELREIWHHPNWMAYAKGTSFEKELELFLFDL